MDDLNRKEIPIYTCPSETDFKEKIHEKRKPVVIKGLNIGPCTEKWTAYYLAEKLGDQEVKIHVTDKSHMNFLNRNFLYRSLPLNELLKRASEASHSEFFISENEYYYLRSIGNNPRKDVADIRKQFPNIADDIIYPKFFTNDQFFSSVLRLASANVSLWTHYDIMDNILMQIQGRKRVVLFPPDDLLNIYLNGDKSEIVDIDNPDLEKYPLFADVTWYECILEPGDVLFIPALWFHNVTSLTFGVAVNVFWRHLDSSFYDAKDPYGNKDLALGSSAFSSLNKTLKNLESLPDVYRTFYYRRMIDKIQKEIEKINT